MDVLATSDVEELSVEEARAMFSTQVSDRLGMSGSEFLRRLDAGDFDNVDNEDVVRLRMLAPFGR